VCCYSHSILPLPAVSSGGSEVLGIESGIIDKNLVLGGSIREPPLDNLLNRNAVAADAGFPTVPQDQS
jgi:hypothetical protein